MMSAAASGHPHERSSTLISSAEIHENDVLCGRGCEISSHPGNRYFRKLVESKNRSYLICNSKKEKTLIAWSVVDDVHARVPPGRFLIKNETPGRGGRGRRRRKKTPEEETWYEIDDKKAREKAAQALREKAPKIREELNLPPSSRQQQHKRSRSDNSCNDATSMDQTDYGNDAMAIGGFVPAHGQEPQDGSVRRKRFKVTAASKLQNAPFVSPPIEDLYSTPRHGMGSSATAVTAPSSTQSSMHRYSSSSSDGRWFKGRDIHDCSNKKQFEYNTMGQQEHRPSSQSIFMPDNSVRPQLKQAEQNPVVPVKYQSAGLATLPHSPIRLERKPGSSNKKSLMRPGDSYDAAATSPHLKHQLSFPSSSSLAPSSSSLARTREGYHSEPKQVGPFAQAGYNTSSSGLTADGDVTSRATEGEGAFGSKPPECLNFRPTEIDSTTTGNDSFLLSNAMGSHQALGGHPAWPRRESKATNLHPPPGLLHSPHRKLSEIHNSPTLSINSVGGDLNNNITSFNTVPISSSSNYHHHPPFGFEQGTMSSD